MTESDSKRVLKNSGWSLFNLSLSMIVTLVSIPIYLKMLGADDYGIYMLAAASTGLLGYLGFGMGVTCTKKIAEHVAKDDERAVTDTFFAVVLVYLCSGLLGAGVLWFLSQFIASSFFHLDEDQISKGLFVIKFSALGFFPTIATGALLGMFEGRQQFKYSQLLLLLRNTSHNVIGIVLLLMGFGLKAVVANFNLVLWFFWLVGFGIILARFIRSDISLPRVIQRIPSLIRFGISVMFLNLGNQILGVFDRLLIGYLLGPAAVTLYAVPQQMALKLHTVMQFATQPVMPFFSNRIAADKKDLDGIRGAFFGSWRFALLFSTATAAPLFAVSPWLMPAWLGDSSSFEMSTIFVFMLATYWLYSITTVPYFFLVGSGRPGRLACYSVGGGVLMLLLMLICIPRFGIISAGACTIVFPLAYVIMAWQVARQLRGPEPGSNISTGIWLVGAILAIPSLTGYFSVKLLLECGSDWIHTGAAAAIAAVFLLVIGFLAYHTENIYVKTAKDIINRLLGRI